MTKIIKITCAISGGGPAGMMLGLLLARKGVDVVVLEKHKDFLRDFRGDTIHPSTIQLMDELGLIDDFLKLPHNKVRQLDVIFGNDEIPVADFGQLKTKYNYIAFMPQWDFLNFLAEHACSYPHFTLLTETESLNLLMEDGETKGIHAKTPEGELDVRADLVIAADGRFSELRDQSGLKLEDFGSPMDVLWFHLQKPDDVYSEQPFGRIAAGKILIMIDRGTYWQCGYIIPKGLLAEMRSGDFSTFRNALADIGPNLDQSLVALRSWDDLSLLNVQINRLEKWWCPGFMCIGDAAHAMSPVGGVGINLAIQDAVAAANILAKPLHEQCLSTDHLEKLQHRRMWPTKITQKFQLIVQARLISAVLHQERSLDAPLLLKLFRTFPYLRRFPAKFVGIGVRPEHITV